VKVPELKLVQTDAADKENKVAGSRPPGPPAGPRPDLAKMTAEREAKMARFR
jgi:hypothetical protein